MVWRVCNKQTSANGSVSAFFGGDRRAWIDATAPGMTDVSGSTGDIMKYTSQLLALILAALPLAGNAGDLVVRDAAVVQPDAELQAVVGRLRAFAASGKKSNIRNVEAYFSRDVSVFQRGLDPFQPWAITQEGVDVHFLDAMAGVMIEQGEYQEGQPAPDYRLDAMRKLAELIAEGGTFGLLEEAPGAICAPAAYDVDRQAALAFARRFELNAYSLRFFSTRMTLLQAPGPGAETVAVVPARTLMMFDYDPKAPEGWGIYETSDGIKGYMLDRDDTLGMAQNHICFAKVKGKYRITAIFGYGL